ncbi:hypothetical protein AB0C65_35640 [Nocardia sp. NPDC048505]|uniref:hypothetical protein n=1 Tax=Nocardia sp. NPDC048505 TaxID=3155756 RepID=UPI003401C1DB
MSNPFADDPDQHEIPDEAGESTPAEASTDEVTTVLEIAPDTEPPDLDQDIADRDDDELAPESADPGSWGPLFSVMPATAASGASTLANWCACAAEIPRDAAWNPSPGTSPWLIITATRDFEGIRRARGLAGALASTRARVAAIVLCEPAPSKGTGGGIQVKEMIAAAESGGAKIITLPYDRRLAGKTEPPQHLWPWSPRDATNTSVPAVLDRVYTALFFTITDATTHDKEMR